MEGLLENKLLLYSILGTTGAIFALALGVVPDIASEFEIVDFPSDVSLKYLYFHKNLFCVLILLMKN